MGSRAVLSKPVVWGDGDGSPEILLGNAIKDQPKLAMESKKAALEAFYEQMANSTDDLTLRDLVQPSATSSNKRSTRSDDAVARMETVLEGEQSEAERSSADRPGKRGLRVGDVLGKENGRPKKFSAPIAKSSRSQTSSSGGRKSSAAATPPRTGAARSPIGHRSHRRTSPRRTSGASKASAASGKATPPRTLPRTPSRTPNRREVAHNFQCKYCFVCGTRPYLFKTRCLVCGKLYCSKCVKKGMGNMLEGPKCVKCLGLPFSETWYLNRLGRSKGCISVPFFGNSRAECQDLVCYKTDGLPSKNGSSDSRAYPPSCKEYSL